MKKATMISTYKTGDDVNLLALVVFPYIALTAFVMGHIYRYLVLQLGWSIQSSEFLVKRRAFYGVSFFHWGVIPTLLGHIFGLLIPQAWYDAMGIPGEVHIRIAVISGSIFAIVAFAGLLLIIRRRTAEPRIFHSTDFSHLITLALLFTTVGMETYNVLFGGFYVLDSLAPWLRGIVTLTPHPSLMRNVPLTYKIHVLSAFALFGYWSFSRLVHVLSVPLYCPFRSSIVYRRKESLS